MATASSFVSRECPDVTIKIAATRSEREAAFRLAYQSYLRAGLCSPCAATLRCTPYQLLPSTDIVIAQLRGEVISTLSLVRDGELGLPMETIYHGEVASRRAAGKRLAEVSCLADRRQGIARFFGLFCELSRLTIQMADREGIDQLLIAVHPRHARLYCSTMGFAQFGADRDYPAVNGRPAVALCLDLPGTKRSQRAAWEKFLGAPLGEEVVKRRPIGDADRRYFERVSRLAEREWSPLDAFAAPAVPPAGEQAAGSGSLLELPIAS